MARLISRTFTIIFVLRLFIIVIASFPIVHAIVDVSFRSIVYYEVITLQTTFYNAPVGILSHFDVYVRVFFLCECQEGRESNKLRNTLRTRFPPSRARLYSASLSRLDFVSRLERSAITVQCEPTRVNLPRDVGISF
jgi:hypothetical protein